MVLSGWVFGRTLGLSLEKQVLHFVPVHVFQDRKAQPSAALEDYHNSPGRSAQMEKVLKTWK